VLFKREDKNIKFFAKVRNSKYKHGTSKPVEILNILVEASSLEGDLVFDPYAGSMSTGEACVLLGRKHLLAEIDPEFYDIGLERLKKITKLE
jgi:site-specific DNA-methyltransferase (adenine-specific)